MSFFTHSILKYEALIFCTRFIPSSVKEREAYVVGGGLEESSAGLEKEAALPE